MSAEWRDARGCLTDAGILAMQAAAPGTAPPELATHVAGCARCQDRLLGGETGRKRTPSGKPQGLQRWRLAILVCALLLSTLAALWTMWLLLGGRDY